MSKRKLLAFALCAALIAVLALSSVFVLTHSHHDCIGKECKICLHIEACVSVLVKTLSVTFALALFFAFVPIIAFIKTGCVDRRLRYTLTAFKVKLNH